MSIRVPLVLISGQLAQLPAADTISVASITAGNVISLTNSEASPIVIGAPVFSFGNSQVKLGKADAAGTASIIGLVRDASISNGVAGSVQTDGTLTATTGQWDAVVDGASGGLIFGTRYYLSPSTAGKLTTTPPSTVSQLVVEIGIAISTVDLLLSAPFRPILL